MSEERLTDEQRAKIDNFLKERIVTYEHDKPYVFVSYRSKDRDIAIREVIYTFVKDYGLNIYYDENFEHNNEDWLTLMKDNLGDVSCKAIMCFF